MNFLNSATYYYNKLALLFDCDFKFFDTFKIEMLYKRKVYIISPIVYICLKQQKFIKQQINLTNNLNRKCFLMFKDKCSFICLFKY